MHENFKAVTLPVGWGVCTGPPIGFAKRRLETVLLLLSANAKKMVQQTLLHDCNILNWLID